MLKKKKEGNKMKRSILTLKQYDYTNQQEFEKHKKEMENKGYMLITDKYPLSQFFNHQEIVNGGKWCYTATYIKQTL